VLRSVGLAFIDEYGVSWREEWDVDASPAATAV
jgi:hypothetical protein